MHTYTQTHILYIFAHMPTYKHTCIHIAHIYSPHTDMHKYPHAYIYTFSHTHPHTYPFAGNQIAAPSSTEPRKCLKNGFLLCRTEKQATSVVKEERNQNLN